MKGGKRQSNFVLCIRNEGADDLEPRKVYQILPDRAAVREGHLRIIDESGEDYLYPADLFVPVKLPAAVARELLSPPNDVRPTARQPRRSSRDR